MNGKRMSPAPMARCKGSKEDLVEISSQNATPSAVLQVPETLGAIVGQMLAYSRILRRSRP
jgi:hypothetical protein